MFAAFVGHAVVISTAVISRFMQTAGGRSIRMPSVLVCHPSAFSASSGTRQLPDPQIPAPPRTTSATLTPAPPVGLGIVQSARKGAGQKLTADAKQAVVSKHLLPPSSGR